MINLIWMPPVSGTSQNTHVLYFYCALLCFRLIFDFILIPFNVASQGELNELLKQFQHDQAKGNIVLS
jgi:hypothetical protein